MRSVSLSLLIIIPVFLNAQWTSFDLAKIEADNFKREVEPFIRSVSIVSVNHFEDQFKINNRFQLGVSYSHGINISGNKVSSDLMGGYPNIGGSLTISDNLKLKGNFGILSSGKDIVQSFAYGAGLKITNNENNNWKMSLLLSELKGPDDISLKTMDGNISYSVQFNEIPVYLGVGSNSYKSKILLDDAEVPSSIKGNTFYLLFGIQVIKGNITAAPVIRLNSEVIVVSLEISGKMN